MAQRLGEDPHSWGNFKAVRVTNYNLHLTVDFGRKIVHGHVDITAEVKLDGASELLLDAKHLAIDSVRDLDSGEKLIYYTVPHHHELAACLRIPLAAGAKKGTSVHFRIAYATTPESGGVQWLDPSQTLGKKHPYVYTQGEAILSRTYVPCQCTPAVKSTYAITIAAPKPLVAVAAGTFVKETERTVIYLIEAVHDGWVSYEYKQPNPIPAYLISFVIGHLVKKPVGPRSSVWTEPEQIEACVHEFSEDTEKYIKAGEEVTGIPYEWGVYDMVVLPSAFPYGGMENPNLTFLSSSLLAGDRSLTNVVAHEITHSWAGNLVTNSSWRDFWLNEGFTVYIERLILGKVHNSEAYRHFEALIGYADLTVNDVFTPTHEYTKLQPNLDGVDPDDAFSKIPYEKGSLFLLHLERLVGGPQAMQVWLKSYFTTFSKKSVSTDEMKAHFLEHFSKHGVKDEVLKSIDWNTWLTAPGLPAFNPNDVLDKSLGEACVALAKKWKDEGGAHANAHDLVAFKAKQTMYFLDALTLHAPLSDEVLQRLDGTYKLSSSKNVEIGFRYIMLALKSKSKTALPAAAQFLSRHGRGLYVRSMYRALNEVDPAFAAATYKTNRPFYHSVIRAVFDKLFTSATQGAKLIDGKALAADVTTGLKAEVVALKTKNIVPGLAVVMMGDRTDSATYVRMKQKAAEEVGIKFTLVHLPGSTSEAALLEKVKQLDQDATVHGIIVQLPLPANINERLILDSISLAKDVDGFHPANIGALAMKGRTPLAVPCTPKGCIEMLERLKIPIAGKHAVVVGRSNIVGVPASLLLLHRDATVTVCHSRTADLAAEVRRADIVVAALGKAEFIKGSWIKPGAVVLDVGINSVPDATRKAGYRLTGDVEFEEAKKVASWITPVPGGVGPMTVAMLLRATVDSASRSTK